MGTVHLLEAVRQQPTVKAVVVVTSDKVYENLNWSWGYREVDHLGGYDPYSNSKACMELVADCLSPLLPPRGWGGACGNGRAGNVIGGGDWAQDKLVPMQSGPFPRDCPFLFVTRVQFVLGNMCLTRCSRIFYSRNDL